MTPTRRTKPVAVVALLALVFSVALELRAEAALQLAERRITMQARPQTAVRRRHTARTAATVVDQYARDVVARRVPAGKYHRLACARHLRGRTRDGTAGVPYGFDPAAADRV